MKNDELNVFGLREYNRQDFFDEPTDEIRFADRFYIMTEADAVLKGQQELIAEKDKEIARQSIEIKEAVKTMKSLEAEIIELKAENKQLKDRLDAANKQCENLINSATDIMLRQDKANDAKRDEIESLKATHYAEMVDAGMRERRLKRALYNLRACYADMMQKRYIECKCDGWVHRVEKWIEVERRCLKKAEEYK